MSNAEIRGKFIWQELLTGDTAAAAAFYPKVLPWRTQPSSTPGYSIWMAGQTQVGGFMSMAHESSGAPPHWLVYVGTPNVDVTCAQGQALGARVVKEPSDIPNVGRFAVLTDPQGAAFAVFTPGSGAPPPGAPPAQGGFSWQELSTTDVAAALRFYSELFGWRKGPGHDMGPMGIYQIFEHAGQPVGGIFKGRDSQVPSSWLSYVHVADVARAAAAAKAAGGRVLNGPMEVPGGSWIAQLLDPQGGAFAVQEMPRAAAAKPAAPPPKAAAAAPKVPQKATVKPVAPKPAAKKKAVKKTAPKKKAKKTARKVGKKAAKKTARKTPRKAVRRGPKKATRRSAPRKARRKR
jgi:uncharacterized protein